MRTTRTGTRFPPGARSRGRGRPSGSRMGKPETGISAPSSAVAKVPRAVELPASLMVKDLADLLGVSVAQVIKELLRNGIIATINQAIDYDTAAVVASDLGFEPKEKPASAQGQPGLEGLEEAEDRPEDLLPRPPVVTILGHVDHGKTSLLDAIRRTNVTATEAGGITQHIGAYQVEIHGQKITFLDTPGHEAFTAMRARGGQAADVAVLVVAADDGVMPQTREAVAHAKAAGVPIVVAINKVDRPGANPDRVKQQLSDLGLLVEEWGGDTVAVPVSALRKTGIESLLEMILLVAEMKDLKANPNRPARGVVIEAQLDKTRGPVATVLVQTGSLKVGDNVVAGPVYGRVRAMLNDKGKRIKKAEPSMPAEILGLVEVPAAGEKFAVVADERTARSAATARLQGAQPQAGEQAKAVTLDDLYKQIEAGQVRELNVILKTDVQGSIEPIRGSLERQSTDEIKVKILHEGTGNVTESDVLLAQASKAIIIGFNVRVEPGARRMADLAGVDIRVYEIIYNLVEDVAKALAGMLEPTYVDVLEGRAEVRQLFKLGKGETVAGCHVLSGKITRGDLAKVKRGDNVVYEGRIASLRRFKEDAREVSAGFECGILVEGYKDLQEGDLIEAYRKERAS